MDASDTGINHLANIQIAKLVVESLHFFGMAKYMN